MANIYFRKLRCEFVVYENKLMARYIIGRDCSGYHTTLPVYFKLDLQLPVTTFQCHLSLQGGEKMVLNLCSGMKSIL